MGTAMKQIREAEKVIETQLNAGFESTSGFRDAFNKIIGAAPKNFKEQSLILKSSWIDTPLGPMLAIGDEEKLYLLEFVERRGLEKEIERLRRKFKAALIPSSTNSIDSIAKELDRYFLGELKEFKTPTYLVGSEFQKKAWQELVKIPYGETRSYLNQAEAIGNPKGFRAVANANGANQLAIIVPCHRIINSDGKLGGYGGGIPKKQWLIDHEKKYKNL